MAGALEGPDAGVDAARWAAAPPLLAAPPRSRRSPPTTPLCSRRRRMDFPLTEARVAAALDAACDGASTDACAALLAPRRAALEGALLDGGAAGFPSLLCAELLRLCSPHKVAGGGEL